MRTEGHSSEPESGRLPWVLFVDDDPRICRAFARLMERAHIPVETAKSAEEGLEMLTRYPRKYGVVATDYYMPGKTGVDLLQSVAVCSPWATRILVSGQLSVQPLVSAINQCGVSQVVVKPWKPEELERAVRRALDRANLALRNATLLEQLKDQNRELRRSISRADAETLEGFRPLCEQLAHYIDRLEGSDGHSFRLARLARVVAEAMGLSPREALEVELASLVHDVGKLIPEPTDDSPNDSLTVSLGTSHPQSGHELLSRIPGLEAVATIVLHHHERYDGLGYPRGLQGTEICTGARMFRAISSFEREVHNLVTMEPEGLATVLQGLAFDAGTRFDPEVVGALQSVPVSTWTEVFPSRVTALNPVPA